MRGAREGAGEGEVSDDRKPRRDGATTGLSGRPAAVVLALVVVRVLTALLLVFLSRLYSYFPIRLFIPVF